MKRFFRIATVAAGVAASSIVGPARANDLVIGFVITPMSPAFTELADAYSKTHPGTTIRILSAGSKTIIDNLNRDLADDFVVFSEQWAGRTQRISAPERLVSTRTVIVLAPGARTKIKSPADLAAAGIRLGDGTPGTGTEAQMNATLDRLGAKYGGDFVAKAKANVVLVRPQTIQLTAALKDGKIDATIVYPSDAEVAGLDSIDPGDASLPVTEIGAVVKGSTSASTVKDFFAFVRSPQGAAILKRHHLDP